MAESICIFEGNYYTRLLPLVYFRPHFDLRCGILSLKEKIENAYPNVPVSLHCREYLTEIVKNKYPDSKVNEFNPDGNSCLLINGRVLADENLSEVIPLEGSDTLYVNGETIIAARVSGANYANLQDRISDVFMLSDFTGMLKQEVNVKYISYPWELISHNGNEIIKDFEKIIKKNENMIRGNIYEGVNFVNKNNIFVDEESGIKPGVVLDASQGPIYIGKGVSVYPNAVIEGPCYIGDFTKVKIGAKIYENTSIGKVCKVGGEIEESILLDYTNKQHDGFLGHAYLGSWVNLGADTNNSDLKNNYGSVRVVINDEQIDSGSMFVGLTMGDHSKTAINTMFNTGTVVGVSTNVFGAGFPPKYIPSFTWGGADAVTTYDLERSIEVAQRVMARRKVEFTSADEKVFKKVFELTKEERRRRGMPN